MPRTERREVWPYRHSPHGLDNVAIRVNGEGVFNSAQSTFLLPTETDSGEQAALSLEVDLAFDPKTILEDSGLEKNEVDLLIVLDHPRARRSDVVRSFPITRAPKRENIRLLPSEYSAGELLLRVVTILNRERRRRENDFRAWRKSALLAERIFSIHLPRTPSLFPVENTSFSERGWGAEALWNVFFRDLSAAWQAPAEEVVEVHLNKDLVALQFVWSTGATRRGAVVRAGVNMARQLIAAEIFADIAVAVLTDFKRVRGLEPDAEPAASSLTNAVLKGLRGLGFPLEELQDLASMQPGELKRRVQNLMHTGTPFGEDAYRALIRAAPEGL